MPAVLGAAFGTAAHLAAGGVRGLQPIAAVQHLVGDVRGQIELQARRIGLQGAVGVDDARRLEEGAHHAAHFAILVARQHRLAVEPADLEAVSLAEAHAGHRPTAETAARRHRPPRARDPGNRCATSPGGSESADARIAGPLVPVWASSSGIAACSTSLEKRNAGSSGTLAAPPLGRWRASAARGRRSRRGTTRGRAETPAASSSSISRGGGALAALDHAEVGDRRRDVPRPAGCSAPDSSSRVRPLRLRMERSLAPRK